MKKLSSLFLLIFISGSLFAQNDKNFKSFYKTYKKEKSIIGISAPIGIAKFFIDRDEKELRRIIRKGKKVRILVFDEEPENMIADIKSLLPAKHYQQFMSVKEDNAIIKFMVRDNLTFISELIIFVYEENSLVVMGIDGKFTYEDIKKLTDNFQEND